MKISEVKRGYNLIYKKKVLKRKIPKEILNYARRVRGNLLDIGCGQGEFLSKIRNKRVKLFGVDISSEAIKAARRRVPAANVYVGDSAELPFKNRMFDYVFCLGSLEHFLNQQKSLREMSRVLKNGGKAYIVVPNKSWYLLPAIATAAKNCRQQPFEKIWDLDGWERLIEGNGLRVDEVKKLNREFEIDLSAQFKLGRIAFFENLLRPLNALIPTKSSYHFSLFAAKLK